MCHEKKCCCRQSRWNNTNFDYVGGVDGVVAWIVVCCCVNQKNNIILGKIYNLLILIRAIAAAGRRARGDAIQ